MRIGIGHDTHRLGPNGPLVIGGVQVEHDQHLIGHSDADVLLHAITDALLGAIGLGDIGELFPDTDPRHQDQDSSEFLMEARKRIEQAGYRIANLDCIVFAQHPKLSKYKPSICHRIAEILQLETTRINVKAKTGELVGPIGRSEAISAECVALLQPMD